MSETAKDPRIDHDRTRALDRVGTAIDRSWRLDALLGVGGMAAVYAATHANGRRGAFKIMHARLAGEEQLVTRFVREQSIAAKIRHPACIDIHGAGTTDDGVPLLVMELLEGETLERRCAQRGRLAIGDALDIGDRLLDFLVACHGAGVVHRDLKPANVFLLRDARMKVLDFGVARESTRRQTNRRLAIGTPSYMSPEQARGAMDVDLRSDLYAVGAILYRLLLGRELPAPSIHRAAPALPSAIADAIDRALSWQREERWATAEQMRTGLRAARASLSPHRASAPVDLHDDDDEDDRPTNPGTPSAIRILQDAELAASEVDANERSRSSSSTPPS